MCTEREENRGRTLYNLPEVVFSIHPFLSCPPSGRPTLTQTVHSRIVAMGGYGPSIWTTSTQFTVEFLVEGRRPSCRVWRRALGATLTASQVADLPHPTLIVKLEIKSVTVGSFNPGAPDPEI